MNEIYVLDYIKRALAGEPIPAPDAGLAAGALDSLASLHSARAAGGVEAVRTVWETIRALRPALDTLIRDNADRLLIHADELKRLTQPITLLPDYPIYDDGFNVLVGPSGCGKSFVALDIAARLALESSVVYIAGEGLSGFTARWEAWKDFHKAGPAELYFYTAALQVLDGVEIERFIGLIAHHKPRLVVIDTLARSAVGVDENSALEIGRFVEACDRLRRILHTTILIVHHAGHNGRIRGSTALYASADSVMAMVAQDDRRILYNDHEYGGKNKHATASPTRHFFIKPHDANGFAGAVLIEAEQVSNEERRISDKQRALLDALDGYDAGQTAKQLIDATALNQSTAYHNLKLLLKAGYITFDGDRYTLTPQGAGVLEF